jgi:hypothetical protein
LGRTVPLIIGFWNTLHRNGRLTDIFSKEADTVRQDGERCEKQAPEIESLPSLEGN